mgnify:CR=1 FL=1
MAKVAVRENENVDDALRRFRRSVNKDGTLSAAKKHECYVKKSLKRKLKSEEARKNSKRKKY